MNPNSNSNLYTKEAEFDTIAGTAAAGLLGG